MTDDLLDAAMDARLRAAGERWRGAADETTRIDTGEPLPLTEVSRRRHRPAPWTLIASAAAVVAALVLGVVLLGRSSSPEPSGGIPLQKTVWWITSFGHAPGEGHAGGGWDAVLTVSDGRLVADDGCTLLTAPARVDGNHLRLGTVELRDESCVDSSHVMEEAILTLHGTATFSVRGDQLTIRNGIHPAMNLVAAPAGTPAPTLDYPTLTGATWRLVRATDARNVAVAVSGTTTLRIDGGKLTAGDTCNTLSATAHRTDSGFGLGEVSTTEIGCAQSTVPALVDSVLSGSIVTTLRNNTLTVAKPGVGRLEYTWWPQNRSTAGLEGRTWTLAVVAGERAAIRAWLRFDGARVTGSDGCAAISGRVSAAPGALTIDIAPVADSCSPQAATLASFLAQPGMVWRLQDGRLVLFGGAGQGFAIAFTTAAAPTPLEGTWKLSTVETGSTAHPEQGTTITARGNEVELSNACVVRSGTISRDVILFRPENRSVLLCEWVFDPITQGEVGWTITDGQLRLTKGPTTLVFVEA